MWVCLFFLDICVVVFFVAVRLPSAASDGLLRARLLVRPPSGPGNTFKASVPFLSRVPFAFDYRVFSTAPPLSAPSLEERVIITRAASFILVCLAAPAAGQVMR